MNEIQALTDLKFVDINLLSVELYTEDHKPYTLKHSTNMRKSNKTSQNAQI